MRRTSGEIIQTDARGRLQLPKSLRKFKLFRLNIERESLTLTPLEVEPAKVLPTWLNHEVLEFLKNEVVKYLKAKGDELKELGVRAFILYGSRARAEALTSSDIDLAVLVNRSLSMTERHRLSESLETIFLSATERLQAHGVTGDFSFNFLPVELPKTTKLPGLYLSLAVDGLCLWEIEREGQGWLAKVQKLAKKQGAKRIGNDRKVRTWQWPNKQ